MSVLAALVGNQAQIQLKQSLVPGFFSVLLFGQDQRFLAWAGAQFVDLQLTECREHISITCAGLDFKQLWVALWAVPVQIVPAKHVVEVAIAQRGLQPRMQVIHHLSMCAISRVGAWLDGCASPDFSGSPPRLGCSLAGICRPGVLGARSGLRSM